jgi:hypothetical protein
MQFETKHKTKRPLRGIFIFFCWCSGARLYLLKRCPTDYNTFFGIGMIVFLTGVMASLSGSYAFFTVFQNLYMAIAFGLFWGTLIFFLDWYLVSSLRKEKKIFREIGIASPRIVLAIFLAIVISRPLELKLFEPEIEAQMQKSNRLKYNDFKTVVDESFNDIQKLESQNTEYQDYIEGLQEKRNALFELIVAEAEGRSPTGQVGKGPVYKEKKREYEQINSMLEEEKRRIYPLIDQNNAQIAALRKSRQVQLNKGDGQFAQATGFLARIEGYNALAENNSSIKYAGWFILLLFVCIETGPMLVKLISRRGAYDELLALEESRKMAESAYELAKVKSKSFKDIEVETHLNELQLGEDLANNETYTKLMAEAQAEIARKRIEEWKQRELNKTLTEFDNYQPTINELIEEAKVKMKPN